MNKYEKALHNLRQIEQTERVATKEEKERERLAKKVDKQKGECE